jgi:hypothetical protein
MHIIFMPKIDACNFTSVNLKMHTNSCCLLLMNLLDLIQTKFLYASLIKKKKKSFCMPLNHICRNGVVKWLADVINKL